MLLWITEHLEGQGWQELCQDRACVLRAAFCFWRPLDSSCGWWTHHCQACWDGHCSVYCKRGRRTRALSPGQEARGLSCREAQPGSQACSSSEACAGVSPCSLAAPPEPRAGKGSALPQRARLSFRALGSSASVFTSVAHGRDAASLRLITAALLH